LTGTHQVVVYTNDVNMLDENINIIKNTGALLEANREVGFEGNTKKSMYMFVSHHQNVGQNHNLLIANKPLENVKLKYMGTTLIYQNAFTKKL